MTIITLKRPIEHEGATYTTIEVDEPTVGAIEAMERAQAAGATSTGATVALLAVDTGWPEGALRKLRASDFEAIGAALAPFAPEPENGGPGT